MEYGLYQHFKGKFYLVVDVARHSETLEDHVIYQALYGKFDSWVHPKAMFEEEVVTKDGLKVPRFQYISAIEDLEDDDTEDVLLMAVDNEEELKAAVQLLEAEDINYTIKKDRIAPKPAHLKSDLFLKIFVDEEDFEDALEILHEA